MIATSASDVTNGTPLDDVLERGVSELPNSPGVYLVVVSSDYVPRFLEQRTGWHFKDRDPNVDIAVPKERWIRGPRELYIGKANSLRRRIRQFLAFDSGHPRAHYGGRLIWQLAESGCLLLEWYEHRSPREEEQRLLREFRARHGRLPFANLQR